MSVELLDLDEHAARKLESPPPPISAIETRMTYKIDESDDDEEDPLHRPRPPPPDLDSSQPRKRYQRFREKKFVCDECGHWFTMKQNVQMHIFNYHMGENRRKHIRSNRIPCDKCNQVFRTSTQLRKHESRSHKIKREKKEKHECDQCDREYSSAHQLREHITITHLKLKPYKCDDCDARFGRTGGLRRHRIMVHTDHKFNCPFEGCEHPGYKCSKALAAHIRSVHTKERPYVCAVCEKSFVRRNDLKMHEETHDPTSGHKCEFCHHAFKRTVYLKKHQRICSKQPGGSSIKKTKKKSKSNTKRAWSSDEDETSMDSSDIKIKQEEFSDDEEATDQSKPLNRPRRKAAAKYYKATTFMDDELPDIEMPMDEEDEDD
ncbi:Zinc finger protein [Aphelenchoides besseyi]|nr:Zinc finger protein [Aphelenchoides besseyi]